MKQLLYTVIILLLCAGPLALVDGNAYAQDKQIRKTFKNISSVHVSTMNGDCVIKKGNGSDVEVMFEHTYSNLAFEPQFLIEGEGTLVLKEKFRLKGDGESTWTVFVPQKTDIRFSSIGGSFSVVGLDSNISAKTVSGDVTTKNCHGQLTLSSISGNMEVEDLSGKIDLKCISNDLKVQKLAGDVRITVGSGDLDASQLEGTIAIKAPSGDVTLDDAKGVFKVKTASGDIIAKNITITKPSYFKVASGEVNVTLGQPLDFDLTLDSASGDAVLNYNGHPIEGYFQFKAESGRGEIICPFPFDKEEEQEKWGKTYLIKSVKRVVEIPKVYIYTATGKAVLKEK